MLTLAWERPRLEVTGPIELVLYAASSARDAEFAAKLVDVFPVGRSMNLAEGILRTRYRNGFRQLELLEPNEPVEGRIRLNPSAYPSRLLLPVVPDAG